MKKKIIKKSKKEIIKTHPIQNLQDDWFFYIFEISNGHYYSEGIDRFGRMVSSEGSDYHTTLDKTVKMAKEINC